MLPFPLFPQFALFGQQNRLSGVHDGPLTTSWPTEANVQRTVSPTLMLTVSGAKLLFCTFVPTAISTVSATGTSPALVQLPEGPVRDVTRSFESCNHTAD